MNKKIFLLTIAIIIPAILVGCFSMAQSGNNSDQNNSADRSHIAKNLPHKLPFIYYLQNINFTGLTKINPAVAVVDPYDSKLTPTQIKILQSQYRQQLFAYISAGEIDPTRTNPDDGYRLKDEWKNKNWLTDVPQEIQDNHRWQTRRIAYWMDGWHKIMLSRTKEMIARGYDGVMLDTVDSFGVFEKLKKEGKLPAQLTKRDFIQDMANLVAAIRDYGKSLNPNFKLFINGGMELYNTHHPTTKQPFLSLIDGQLKEDTWYNENGAINAAWTPYDLKYIERGVAHGIPIFSIEYFSDGKNKMPIKGNNNIAQYINLARAAGVIPFIADRQLGSFLEQNIHYFDQHEEWQAYERYGVGR